ncbi:RNA-directed DNA polymerase, eukaryota, reverse transcriptase zinc-binding domain protein [Tanacetum coccineum]
MTWSKDMVNYFKEKWEKDRQNERNAGLKGVEEEDVVNTPNGTGKFMDLNKVNSMEGSDWEWFSNMDVCNKGSRIMIGWDRAERRDLWKVLLNDHIYVNRNPWCIVGDMNVILNPNEHSCGTSIINSDMVEFQDCLNAIEIEDISSSSLQLKEATLVKEFCEAESDEEKFVHQQAKIKWLCDGEKNSKYFHRVLKGISNKRKVFSLRDDSGNSYEQDQIPNLFLKHFEEFLGSTYPIKGIDSSGNLFKRKLSVGDANKMITNVSDTEIKRALFDIDDSKAPGPDGFTAAFCKKAWSIVDVDTCNAVREFFSSGKMLEELNATFVSLIPKIMQCVSTAAFTLNINEDRIGYFKGRRGLRQGDPISPYLCTLIMEVFSLILQREIDREPLFQYHFGCKNLKVSHVCFDDDLLVMCHGDATFVSVIKKALDEFSACSGLLLNNSKSTVFFGSMNKEDCSAISNILPFVTGKLPVRYLGVPLIAKRMGNDSANGKAKVAWSSIYKPKDQRGLGLRNLKLRGKIIWEIFADKEDSWGWKNLLEIRDQIKDYVVYKIGDGNRTSFWFDNWSEIGPLFDHITYMDLYDERLTSCLKVSDMIGEGEWKWPSEWHHKFPMITSLDVPAINTDIEDKIVWKSNSGMLTEFSVSIANHDLNRLTTQDKLHKWGNHVVNGCSFCLKDAEDLQHLFFQCPFSTDVWDRALLMANMRGDKNAWQSILHGMSDARNGNNVKSVIRRLLLAACVYHIWQERNNRIFKDSKRSSEEVFKSIVDVIKNKLSGITVKASNAISEVEKQWPISCKRAYQKPFNGKFLVAWSSSGVAVPINAS